MIRKAVKRINMKDVAKTADVSIATVSKIINGKDQHISAQTRQTVLDIIKQMGYVPNDMARRLKNNNSRTIGLILPEVSNAFPEMVQGIQDEAIRHDYSVFLFSTSNNPLQEERSIKLLMSKMVDGIIYISSNYKTGERLIQETNIPYVAIDREFDQGDYSGSVLLDNYKAMKEVAKFLVENKCQKIGYVTSDISQSPCKKRFEGLCDGLREQGIEFDKKLLYTGAFSIETGYMGALTLIERCKDIDCIACGNDLIAVGVMNVCNKIGIKIPDQIKVIGFDDIYIAKYLNPELTTVRQNPYEMGRVAAQMLIEHFDKDKPLEKVILNHELIQRGSV